MYNNSKNYLRAYQKAALATPDQGRLMLMLYDGALRFLAQASRALQRGDLPRAHEGLFKGRRIIAELLSSLDVDNGGPLASHLQQLYAYMFTCLVDANLHKDRKRLEHVIHLLTQLRRAWHSQQTQQRSQRLAQQRSQQLARRNAQRRDQQAPQQQGVQQGDSQHPPGWPAPAAPSPGLSPVLPPNRRARIDLQS